MYPRSQLAAIQLHTDLDNGLVPDKQQVIL